MWGGWQCGVCPPWNRWHVLHAGIEVVGVAVFLRQWWRFVRRGSRQVISALRICREHTQRSVKQHWGHGNYRQAGETSKVTERPEKLPKWQKETGKLEKGQTNHRKIGKPQRWQKSQRTYRKAGETSKVTERSGKLEKGQRNYRKVKRTTEISGKLKGDRRSGKLQKSQRNFQGYRSSGKL